MTKNHSCSPENAPKFREWIRNRGGIAIWFSADLGNPGASWLTPALTLDGKPMEKQGWQWESKPREILTNESQIDVIIDKEVKRFRVAHKRGSGLSYVLTNASSRKVREAIAKAGKDSHYVFDFETQECIILAPENTIPLTEYLDSFEGTVSQNNRTFNA